MTVAQVYQKYQIPPNLQRHMLQVAAVGEYLREHWQGPTVDWRVAKLVMLLHDMGNIVKFKRPFLGELEADATHWEQVQADFITKYGPVTHVATATIIRELGLSPALTADILATLTGMKKMFDGEDEISWETRVVEYADCVVTPNGIEGFEVRIMDLHTRYGKTDPSWQLPFRHNATLMQGNVDTDLHELPDQDFSSMMQKLAQTQLVTAA